MSDEDMYKELMDKIRAYHPGSDFSKIEKAYLLAKAAHSDQVRKSGEPYIIHPLAVSNILADLEMDIETITSGILHDVIEDTDYSYDDITSIFGEEVALLVDGVTKLEKLRYSSLEEVQAENYRKMFIAMAKDIRVILIKIADRLHNMRTLKYMTPEKQEKIAQETIDIYAPLAHRLGISKIRNELEDLSFRYTNPEKYFDLKDKISRKQSERVAYVDNIITLIKHKLSERDIFAEVDGRPKHFFSIYKKMVQKDKSLDQIYDLFAIRVIVDSMTACYEVLGIIHEMFRPVPGRFKDYIALPKSNMYQSLHNTLLGPEGEPFEVQIRTGEMHRAAEYGIAAHWKYKSGQDGPTKDSEETKLAWLRQILEWQRDLSDNREYLETIKRDLNVFNDQVYVFSPKGMVISLTNGACPIDFAYAIHSAVGHKMVGAKVDNRIVSLDYVLKTGERVEILTSQNSRGPSKDWLKLVKTSQARNKINQWFKKENREENIIRGKEMLEKGAKKKGLTPADLQNPKYVAAVLNRFGLNDWDLVCASVGHGNLTENQVLNRIKDERLKEINAAPVTDEAALLLMTEASNARQDGKKAGKSGVIIKGIGDIPVRFSKCCSPVPGDEIIGFVTRGRGVSVHRTDCQYIIHLDDLERHRLIEAEWSVPDKSGTGTVFQADLHIVCDDRPGLLVAVSRVFDVEKIEVKSVNLRTIKNNAIFDVAITITSKEQLEKIKTRLLNVPGITDILRVST